MNEPSAGPSLSDLASRFGGRVVGDASLRVRSVATLEKAGSNDLAFLTNPRYRKAAEKSAAGAIRRTCF